MNPIFILLCVILLLPQAGHAQTARLSQPRINELAAALHRAESDLLEAPKIRLAGETVPSYFRRLVATLPNESIAKRKIRLLSYIVVLEQAAKNTAEFRTMPALCDSSAGNVKQWQTLVAAFAALPRDVKTLTNDLKFNPVLNTSLSTHFTNTLYTLHSAYEILRDARP